MTGSSGAGDKSMPPPPKDFTGNFNPADFEMGNKRVRRTRPLDLERAMPVVVGGRPDEETAIR